MLCAVGEYTGVGIKTGIGMGAIRVLQMRRQQTDKNKEFANNTEKQDAVAMVASSRNDHNKSNER